MQSRDTLHPSPARAVRSARSTTTIVVSFLAALVSASLPAVAVAELFDFDSAPIHGPLPMNLTVGSITAQFSATGQGFSIQPANSLGFTPAGFAGLCIYPSSIYAADLLIRFTPTLTDFSIMFAPEEYACDGTATMRVTAYLAGALVGTATATAPTPGTWPTGTLSFSDPTGFDSVVVHYDAAPPPCDYGPIFMADNMTVTARTVSVPTAEPAATRAVIAPNPFRASTAVCFGLAKAQTLTVTVHDAAGRRVRTLASALPFTAGAQRLEWDGRDDAGARVGSGVYFCRIGAETGVRITRVILLQ